MEDGRYCAERLPLPRELEESQGRRTRKDQSRHSHACLLRRYGVVSRRIAEKESLSISWFELLRVFRRIESRGEIRGGYFVGWLERRTIRDAGSHRIMRSLRKLKRQGQLTAISAADPLNLVGILTSGPRIAAVTAHRILLRDGVPIAALKAGQVIALDNKSAELDRWRNTRSASEVCRLKLEPMLTRKIRRLARLERQHRLQTFRAWTQ